MNARHRQGRAGAAGLSRDQVIAAALEIVETEGAEGLTVRSLAAKLGVAVTAVYWHVGDKQALMDGIVDHIIVRLGEVDVRGRGTEARVVSIGHSLRRALLERADLVALVHRQGRTAALFQPARRILLVELARSGLGGADAALAVHAVLNLVVGSVLIDRQVERQPTQREAPEELWGTGDLPDVPDAPDLLRHLTHHLDEEQVFDYSLRVLVKALTAGADAPQRSGGRRP